MEWATLNLGWWMSNLFPDAVTDGILGFAAATACAASNDFRQKVIDKYRRLLGINGTPQRCLQLAEGMVKNFLYTLEELREVMRMTHVGPREFVEFHNMEYVDAALARGKGAVLATVHLGNWEFTGSALSLMDYPLYGVAWSARNPLIERYIQFLRKHSGLRTIFPDQHAQLRIYRQLKANSLVAFVLDIGQWENGIPVNFCGDKYLFPKGPLFFAARTGASLIPSVNYRDENKRLHLAFEKPLEIPETLDEEQEIVIMQTLASTLEGHVRAHPEQWLWIPSDSEFISEMRNHEACVEQEPTGASA